MNRQLEQKSVNAIRILAAEELFRRFGFTADHVVDVVKSL